MVAVPIAGATSLFSATPSHSGRGSVKLLRDVEGRRRHVTYATIARSNPWVMTAVNERAGLASRTPMHVYRPDPAGRQGHRERVRAASDGPGARLVGLLEQPEARVSGRRFRRRLVGDVLVHANAIAELLRSGSQVVGMRWHPWADVDPILTRDGLAVDVFRVPVERHPGGLGFTPHLGDMRPLDPVDVLHLTIGDDTAGPLGVSPLASLHATHALHEAAWRFARSYLEEGMFPTGVVEMPPQATIEQATLTRELIEALYTGVDRAGKPALLGFGKWQQIMATPEGAQLVELAKSSREEVGAAYRLAWLGNVSDMNRATAIAARQAFIRDVVGEDVAVLETELNAQLVQPQRRWSEASVWIEAQLGELLRPDMEALSKVVHSEVGGPVLTPNEGRKLLNYPPLDDPRADELVLSPGTPSSGSSSSGRDPLDEPPDDG